jgi:DNA repair exonuclease SbcCD ATPase subunit
MAKKNDTSELIAEQRYQKRLSDHHLSQQQKDRKLIDTKSEIQENIAELKRRQKELTDLRNKAEREFTQLSADIERQEKNLTDRMGTGLEFLPIVNQLEKDRAKLEDIKGASNEADQGLIQLKAEQAIAEMNLVRIDFNQLNDEADILLADCLEKLESAETYLNDYRKKLGQINLIIDAANPGTGWVEYLRMKGSICQYLTDDGTHKLTYRLLELKNNHPKYFADCEGKRNKANRN